MLHQAFLIRNLTPLWQKVMHGLGDSRGGVDTGTEALHYCSLHSWDESISIQYVYHCICFIVYHYFHSGQEAEEM